MKKLYHDTLIIYLNDTELIDLFARCCVLKSVGWSNKKTIDYVGRYPYSYLARYHLLVMREMRRRDIQFDLKWFYDVCYRGVNFTELPERELVFFSLPYEEHDNNLWLEQTREMVQKSGDKSVVNFYNVLIKDIESDRQYKN